MVVQPEIAVLLEEMSAQDQVLHHLEVAHPEAVMLLEPEAAPVRKKYRLALRLEAVMARETEQDLRHPEVVRLQELDLHHPEEDMTRDETRQNIEIVLEVVREICHPVIEGRMSTRVLRTTRGLVEVPVRLPRPERSVSAGRYYL